MVAIFNLIIIMTSMFLLFAFIGAFVEILDEIFPNNKEDKNDR